MNPTKFAGSILKGLGEAGRGAVYPVRSAIDVGRMGNVPHAVGQMGALAAGGAGAYALGRMQGGPSDGQQEIEIAQALMAHNPGLSDEEAIYEAQRILYDHREDMTPQMEGGGY
jgi:hypothetical protein